MLICFDHTMIHLIITENVGLVSIIIDVICVHVGFFSSGFKVFDDNADHCRSDSDDL